MFSISELWFKWASRVTWSDRITEKKPYSAAGMETAKILFRPWLKWANANRSTEERLKCKWSLLKRLTYTTNVAKRSPPRDQILIPSHFVPPPIMEVLVDPPPNGKKSYFHPSETFKLLLLECHCGLTIVRRNTH